MGIFRMSPSRKLGLSALLIVSVIAITVHFGSRDAKEHDDQGLDRLVGNLSEGENGYSAISYLNGERFKLFEYEETSQRLKRHVTFEEWDSAFVTSTLHLSEKYRADAIAAQDRNAFQFPIDPEDPVILPSFLPVMDMSRLLILQSMRDAGNEDFDRAIEHAGYALNLAQKVKTESNHWLISYMIGIVMVHEALAWLQVLGTEFDLSSEQLGQLAQLINSLPAYSNDAFSQIFAGEYVYANRIVDDMLSSTLWERLISFKESVEYQLKLDADSEYAPSTALEHTQSFLFALFPEFYVHDNRMRSESAVFYKGLYEKSNFYCGELEFEEMEEFPELRLRHLFSPNSYLALSPLSESTYEFYFYRRCLSQAHIEAAKAIIGIKRYTLKNDAYPSSLSELVPEYLSVEPVDPFDGAPIRYDLEKKYLYSVGQNIEDNGGSSESFYYYRCYESEACSRNPTFPLYGHSIMGSGSDEGCKRHP